MSGSSELSKHHQAIPEQILIAVISVLLALGDRADLIIPDDVDFTISYSYSYSLLSIKEPKTRYRAAKHQSGKLEPVFCSFLCVPTFAKRREAVASVWCDSEGKARKGSPALAPTSSTRLFSKV